MNHKSRADLAIVGAYPPPYGGVTIHVMRLRPLLEQTGIDFVIYNACSAYQDEQRVRSVWRGRHWWLLRYLFFSREPAVYFLSGRLSTWLAAAWLKIVRSKRVMVRLQNAVLIDWVKNSAWRRFLTGFAFRRLDGVVCVSQALRDAVMFLGVEPAKALWFPGFLPPVEAESSAIGVDTEVRNFIDRVRPLISANGKVAWHNGEDLYGLDLLIELLGRLKSDFPEIGLIFCFSDVKPADREYLEKIRARAEALGVTEKMFLRLKPGHFLPILKRSTLFVRPTNTDGDANSVREALAMGIPVVASDAAERPVDIRLFPCRDLDILERVIREILDHSRSAARQSQSRLSTADQQRIQAYVNTLVSLTR